MRGSQAPILGQPHNRLATFPTVDAWIDNFVTHVSNVADREGNPRAVRVLETTANQFHSLFAGTLSTAKTVRMRAIVKAVAGRQWCYLDITPFASADQFLYFDIINGVIGSLSGPEVTEAMIDNLGGGWFRISALFTISMGAPKSFNAAVGPSDVDNGVAYVGDVTKGYEMSDVEVIGF